ncbi:hypothetical protein [Aliarcobacter skirrowii]|uniref:hypothetical protein n=1 Tax=Aliarcobacter skirrowii TaxID=28200 RepID=UPI002A36E5DB|nr:hypothetical protein [Aliarcobacter skirrowii]MDY0180427.1 hypothetical protein [Aliarcobacter skirrowii]
MNEEINIISSKASIINNIFLSFSLLAVIITIYQFYIFKIDKIEQKYSDIIKYEEKILDEKINRDVENIKAHSNFTGIVLTKEQIIYYSQLDKEYNKEKNEILNKKKQFYESRIMDKKQIDYIFYSLVIFILIIIFFNVIYQIRNYLKISKL